MFYTVYGWKDAEAFTGNYLNITAGGATGRTDGDAGNAVYDLSTGAESFGNINTKIAFAGTAGTRVSASITIDLSGYAVGQDNIDDFDYFSIAFGGDATAPAGGILDNVSVAVPEPATLGMVVFSGLGILVIRRHLTT